jgi:hypothetical protein
MFGPKSSNIGLQRLLAMRKAHVWRAFLIQRRKFSETRAAWLTWEDSNSHIPNSKMAFEMSGEFRTFPRNLGLETFAAES